jgi:hypothetical protein
LIIEVDGPLTYSSSGCTVASGVWDDPYTATRFTSPSDVDIDHMVPLSDAHRSGGWQWSSTKKRLYANDLDHPETLIAVDDGSNSSKSDKSPDQWMPPNVGYHCTYAIEWVDIKATWALTVTTPERTTLTSILNTC